MNKQARAWIFTTVVLIATACITALTAWMWPLSESSSPFWLLLFLAVMVTVAGRFPIELSKSADASLRVVPLFTAVLLVHPTEAALIAAVGTLVSELLIKAPPRAWVFNVGVDSFAAVAAGMVFFSLRPEGSVIALTASQMLPAGAAGLTLLVINFALVDFMSFIRRGWEFLNHWKFTYYVFETPQEAGFLTIGLIGALLTAQAWWAPVVILIPAALTYIGFKYVVSEAAAKTQMAEDLQQSLAELKEVQAQLVSSAKMASVGSLATGIAHEINNPVFAISGRADLLIKGSEKHLSSDKALEYVENIKEMASRISNITSHLMDYAQPDEEKKEVLLNEVMEAAVTLMGEKAKSVRVVREYEGLPVVEGVQSQLQQVFVNLLTNSAEALPDWGTVTIGCSVEGDKAVAYVKDDGIGLAPEVRERLFEPFVSSKEVDHRVGMGLGLYTCHKIVTAHEGEISVDSEEGKGTTVWVRIPLAQQLMDEMDYDLDSEPDDPDMPMAIGMQD